MANQVRSRPAAVRERPAAEAPEVPDERGPGRAARLLRSVPVELAILTFLAAVTRLAALTHPRAIVFDEVYFREYALRYVDGTFFFDLHPPLGKLILAVWAQVAGVSATPTSPDPAVALRVAPALAGALLIPVVYQFLRELSSSRKVATLGAALLLLDNALLVESRFILIDSFLLLFGVGALTCYLASRRATGRAHWVLLASAAVLAGMALSTKWTGLAALGVIGVTWAAFALRERTPWRRVAVQAGVLLVLPALVYSLVWTIHFGLLTKSGPGDAYLSAEYQATLEGSQYYDPAAGMSVPDKFFETNRAIHSYETSLNDSTHPYESSFLSWPLMKRGVYYWNGPADGGRQDYVYLLGNPFVWWGILLGVVVVAVGWLRRPDLFARHRWQLGFLAFAWVANYLPFATIERPMFLYHYFFALIFSLGFVVLGLGILAGWMSDTQPGWARKPRETVPTARKGSGSRKVVAEPDPPSGPWRFRSRRSLALYGAVVALAAVTFAFFAPISYGTPLTDEGLERRMWLSTWR